MQWRKHLGMILLVVAIVAALGYGFWPRPIPVDGVKVIRAPLTVTIDEEGKTRVIDRFVISAPVAGFARRIQLDVGDSVTQGQVLVELEPLRSQVLDPRSRAEAQARVAAARSALQVAEENSRAAQADADFATTELERMKRLRQTNSVSQEALEQAETRVRRTQANLRSAKFAVEVARFELDAAGTTLQYSAAQETGGPPEKVAIRAPVNGNVLKLYRQSEGVVTAGQPLIEVGNPRALEVEVDVLSADAVRIKPGGRLLFYRWGGDTPLEGIVRVVEPVGFTKVSALGVEEQRVWVIADIASPPEHWQRLGDGYRVEASFILWEESQVLQVPVGALFRYGDGWALFAVENDQAQRRIVEVGQRNGMIAQVLSGVAEGDVVISHPADTVEDGRAVRLRSAAE